MNKNMMLYLKHKMVHIFCYYIIVLLGFNYIIIIINNEHSSNVFSPIGVIYDGINNLVNDLHSEKQFLPINFNENVIINSKLKSDMQFF